MNDISINTQLEIKRDYAWSLTEKSYEASYLEFQRLYNEEKDTLSAYISAYISDYYLNDMRRTINHYKSFIYRYPEHSHFPQAENRLKSIEMDLSMQKAISKQGIDYKYAIQFFQEEKDFDSTKVLLDYISKGENSQYKDAANRLKSVIRDYTELKEAIQHHKLPVNEDKSM